MTPIQPTEQYIQKLQQKSPNVELVSEYLGARRPVSYKCKVCGNTFTASKASYLLEGHGCRICLARERGKALRKSPKQFENELQKVNPTISLLCDYVTNEKKIKCRCDLCGHIWDASPGSLLDGHSCPNCAHEKQNWLTHEAFSGKISVRFPNIIFLSDYKGTTQRIDCKCSVCDTKWSPFASVLLGGKSKGCPVCSRHCPPPEQQMRKRVETENPWVEYVKGYVNMTTHATWKCKRCGKEWQATPSNVRRGRSCPWCKMSHGEQKIMEYLKGKEISFLYQHKFEDCRLERPLPFDFYLPSANTCIEYDGVQHFEPTAFGDSTEIALKKFHDIQRSDKIKTEYCHKNSIQLLRIPYTEYEEIFSILSKYIP